MNLVLMKSKIRHSSTTKIVLCITNKGPQQYLSHIKMLNLNIKEMKKHLLFLVCRTRTEKFADAL